MTFTALSPSFQNVILYSFESKLKAVMLFGLFFFCVAYIGYFFPKHKDTPFFTVAIARMIFVAISWAVIGMFPLALGMLSPELPIGTFISIMLYPYLTFLLLMLVMVLVDLLYLGIPYMLKFVKIDMGNPRINKAIATLKKYSKRVS